MNIHYKRLQLYNVEKYLTNCVQALEDLHSGARSRREEDKLTEVAGVLVDARGNVEKLRVELETGEQLE